MKSPTTFPPNVVPRAPTNRAEAARKGFEQAREAWLTWRADSRISHADRVLMQQVYLGFNRQHYERTGKLVAWPGWEKIAAEAHLSKTSIFRGFRRFELFGILEIRRGGRDPKTGRKLPNSYRAIMPPGFAAKPDQVSPCSKTRFRRETRLTEERLTEEEEEKNFKNGNSRGPTAPEKESKPSSTASPGPSPRSAAACDVPRAPSNGGAVGEGRPKVRTIIPYSRSMVGPVVDFPTAAARPRPGCRHDWPSHGLAAGTAARSAEPRPPA